MASSGTKDDGKEVLSQEGYMGHGALMRTAEAESTQAERGGQSQQQ